MTWPTVGTVDPDIVESALVRYASDEGFTREQVGGRRLYGAAPEGGSEGYLLLQVSARSDAQTLGVS